MAVWSHLALLSFTVPETQLGLAYLGSYVFGTLFLLGLAVWIFETDGQTRGVQTFFGLLVCITVWGVFVTIHVLSTDPTVMKTVVKMEIGFGMLTSFLWFVFASQYAEQDWHRRRITVATFALVSLGYLGLTLTNSSHHLMWEAMIVHREPFAFVESVRGPAYLATLVVLYGIVGASFTMLYRFLSNSRSGIRTQVRVLLVIGGASTPIVLNLLSLAGAVPVRGFDHAALGIIPFALAVSIAVFRFDLLELVPVARDTIVDTMSEGVFVIDTDDRIVDINPRGRELLGLTDQAVIGKPVSDVLDADPSLLTKYDEVSETRTERDFETRIGDQYVRGTVSPLYDSRDHLVGHVFIVLDISQIKAREEELQTLRDVLSRILRHNIRNDLTVIIGNAEQIEHRCSDDCGASARTIIETASDVIDTSAKTRIVDQIVGAGSTTVEHDVAELVTHSLDGVDTEARGVTVHKNVPDGLTVVGTPHLQTAVLNAVENAIEHNDSDTPVVEIEAESTGDTVALTVTDNGPGISSQDLAALQSGEETPLVHGSGLGLWLIDWIVSKSGGSVTFENTDSGCRVAFEFSPAQ